jgi:Domain of unknown function (DUF4157)
MAYARAARPNSTVGHDPKNEPTHAAPAGRRGRLSPSRLPPIPDGAPPSVYDVLRSPGMPLDAETRTVMGTRLGHDFAQVRVHTDDRAVASARTVDALAYTVGSSIVFDRGRYAPHEPKGRGLLAHELVHTIQQAGAPPSRDGQLRVDPQTSAEEVEAGAVVAAAASQRSPARALRSRLRSARPVVQRAVSTWGGDWSTDNYAAVQDVNGAGAAVPAAQNVRGADITLRFKPNTEVNAELLGLTQSVQSFVAGALAPTPAAATRAIPAADAKAINTGAGETDVGTAIDRASGYTNPIYPVQTAASASLADPNTSAGWGQLGWRYLDAAHKLQQQDATLIDAPRRSGADKDSRQVFEVAALATKGVQAGTFYGSVRWGWRTDSAGTLSKIDLVKVSDGVPSSTFIKAAGIWDKGKSSAGDPNVKLNAPQVMVTTTPVTLTPQIVVRLPIALPVGTRVRVINGFGPPWLPNTGTVEVVDGPNAGVVGEIHEPLAPVPVLAAERP